MSKMIVLHGLEDSPVDRVFTLGLAGGLGAVAIPSPKDGLKFQITALMLAGYKPVEAVALLKHGVQTGLVARHGAKWFVNMPVSEVENVIKNVRKSPGLNGLGLDPLVSVAANAVAPGSSTIIDSVTSAFSSISKLFSGLNTYKGGQPMKDQFKGVIRKIFPTASPEFLTKFDQRIQSIAFPSTLFKVKEYVAAVKAASEVMNSAVNEAIALGYKPSQNNATPTAQPQGDKVLTSMATSGQDLKVLTNAVLGVAASVAPGATEKLTTQVQTAVDNLSVSNPEIKDVATQISAVVNNPATTKAVEQMQSAVPASAMKDLQSVVPDNYMKVKSLTPSQDEETETDMKNITTADKRTPVAASFSGSVNPLVVVGMVAAAGIGFMMFNKK